MGRADGFYYDALRLADGEMRADQGPLDGRADPAPAARRSSRPGWSSAAQALGKHFARFLAGFDVIERAAPDGRAPERAPRS